MPKISVISASFNTGAFFRDTIESVARQSSRDYEHIVVDGASTDGTVDELKRHPEIRWVSEPDSGFPEAFRKGVAMARGEYIIQCSISDGFLDPQWFARCIAVLDNDPTISVVWGLPQSMSEDGVLGKISYERFLSSLPPTKEKFLYEWLFNCFWFPEGNFCVRKSVFEKCFPSIVQDRGGDQDLWLEFNNIFHQSGYLSAFIPVVANYGRAHAGARSNEEAQSGIAEVRLARYRAQIAAYRHELAMGSVAHRFRAGNGSFLQLPFSRAKLILLYVNPRYAFTLLYGSLRLRFKNFLKHPVVLRVMPAFLRRKIAARLRMAV